MTILRHELKQNKKSLIIWKKDILTSYQNAFIPCLVYYYIESTKSIYFCEVNEEFFKKSFIFILI